MYDHTGVAVRLLVLMLPLISLCNQAKSEKGTAAGGDESRVYELREAARCQV